VNAFAVAMRAPTFRSLRRHRNYRIYMAGQLASTAGTWMQHVALAWFVIDVSSSALAVGILTACRLLPFTVLGLVAGVVIDRNETRRLMIGVQAAAMAVSAALAAATLAGAPPLELVYALAAAGGVVLAFDAPGRQALTYELVGPRELANAVALNSGLFNLTRIVGPALAGGVIALVGVGACFVANAVSFLAVLVSLAALRPDELFVSAKDAGLEIMSGLREAVAHALGHRETGVVLGLVAISSMLGFNFHVLVPLLATDRLHVGPETFGLLCAAFGVGSLIGALWTATSRAASFPRLLCGAIAFSLGLLALAPVRGVPIAAALLVVLGASFTLLLSNANALVQLAAPDHLRGRMIGLYMFSFAGLAPAGALLTGWLAELGGTALAFGVGGTVGLVAVAVAVAHARRPVASLDGLPSFEGS
jgi:MFS family permease